MANKKVIIGVLLALIAVICIYVYFDTKEKEIMDKTVLKEVLVASQYISANTRITEDMVKVKKIAKLYVQPGAVSSFENIKDYLSLVPISAEEQILENKLTKAGTSLGSYVPIGKRAVTVLVEHVDVLSKMIKPGDNVDVICSFDVDSQGKTASYTVTILQNVQVVAIGSDFYSEKKRKTEEETIMQESCSSFTLLLSPEEAETIIFAENKGKLSLTVRTLNDNSVVQKRQVKFSTLLKGLDEKVQAQSNKGNDVEIIK